MRILVTGGAGFIGRRLIEKMVERGHEPVCFDLVETDLCESIVGDITDREAVSAAVEGVEAVVHLAAVADVNHARREPAKCVAVNVGGTQNLSKPASSDTFPYTSCQHVAFMATRLSIRATSGAPACRRKSMPPPNCSANT